jgi:hypothetical protein
MSSPRIDREARQSESSDEVPVDYSMTRKRRILEAYVEPLLNKAKKTLDYGSDGHSEDHSCVGSPVQTSSNSLTSSPEAEPSAQLVGRHPHLPELPLLHQQHHHHAAALQLLLQVQQQKQQAELLHNNLHSAQPACSWMGSPSPSPPSTPLLATSTRIEACPASTPSSGPGSGKDSAYWERRRKNNEAAKRSRDARRMKEQQVAMRAQFLEQENIQLKLELAHLRAENGQLREQFYLQLNSNPIKG